MYAHVYSPFAPVDGGIASEMPSLSAGGASCDEGALKEDGSKSMTLVDQVLHQDCIPVLEFEIVSTYAPLSWKSSHSSISLSLSPYTSLYPISSETRNGDSI